MTEALAGQIYLVLVVARLVSLWGRELPRHRQREEASGEAARRDEPYGSVNRDEGADLSP
jgi:hypothetical protein